MMRTHTCGELRAEDIGKTVSLAGWVNTRREHSQHLAFVDLRDHTGLVQCVVDNDVDVRSEYVLRITGTVEARFEGSENTELATGAIEIRECTVEVLNSATPPPFPMDDRADEVDELIRLKHRYIDLRRQRMQKNLRIRSTVNTAIRNAMVAQDFVECRRWPDQEPDDRVDFTGTFGVCKRCTDSRPGE